VLTYIHACIQTHTHTYRERQRQRQREIDVQAGMRREEATSRKRGFAYIYIYIHIIILKQEKYKREIESVGCEGKFLGSSRQHSPTAIINCRIALLRSSIRGLKILCALVILGTINSAD
jgi:hypothetical protein